MKKLSYIKVICLVIATTIVSFSCERDDICAEGTLTTPKLVIEFFNATVTDEDISKNVTGLWVEAVNPNTDEDGNIVNPIQTSAGNVATISIPLRTQANSTAYKFISNYQLDADGNQLGNVDIITFNYETSEVFLSRACGFATNYRLNDPTGVVVTTDTDNWIHPTTGINITQFTIQDETIAHVKIYH